MRLKRNESGSTLIMVIGIIAALAIMSATLVVLVTNAQSGTAKDRTRVKAFNVAEAALDEGMYQLSASWPQALGETVFDSAMQGKFGERFNPVPTSPEYPNLSVTVKYYDDTAAGGMDTSKDYDSTANNMMWVVAQARTGSKVVRIQAKVQRTLFDTTIPRGNVIYSGGPMNHASGNEPAQVDTTPGSAYTEGPMWVKIAGDDPLPKKNPVYPGSGIQPDPLYGAAAGSLESVFPEATKQGLRTLAISHGRYFTSIADALNPAKSKVDPVWSPQGGISGLTVIEPTVAGTLTMPKVGPINSEAKPGIVLLLKSPNGSLSNLDFEGSVNKTDYYGVLYTDGTVVKGTGGYNVHGMLVGAANTEFQGTVNVLYNDNCIVNLGQLWASNVKIVGNSWRELPPETNP